MNGFHKRDTILDIICYIKCCRNSRIFTVSNPLRVHNGKHCAESANNRNSLKLTVFCDEAKKRLFVSVVQSVVLYSPPTRAPTLANDPRNVITLSRVHRRVAIQYQLCPMTPSRSSCEWSPSFATRALHYVRSQEETAIGNDVQRRVFFIEGSYAGRIGMKDVSIGCVREQWFINKHGRYILGINAYTHV